MTSDTDSKFGKIFVFCIVMGSLKSNKIEITAYNFENIVRTSRFSLWERDNCTQNQKHALVLSTGHVLYHESLKIQLNYCMFQAAYTVSGLKKNTWWDDAVFIQENSQLIPTYYPLTSEACSKLLQGISVNYKIKHKIKLEKDAKPFRRAYDSMSFEKRKAIKK